MGSLARLADKFGFFPCTPGTKAPDTALCGDHNRFRKGSRPTPEEIEAWAGKPIGIWAGENGLQLLDVDVAGVFGDWWRSALDNGLEDVLAKCAVVETAHGYHVWCLVPGCTDGNQKLARYPEPIYSIERDKDIQTIIETRGVGGYGLIPPSEGYRYESARTLLDIEPISIEDWKAICLIARTFDQAPAESVVSGPRTKSAGDGERPGDDYAKRGPSIVDLLEKAGWRLGRKTTGQRISLTRPGKDSGISGTVTGDGQIFFCFSSNAHPFEEGKAYSHFAVYTMLEHRGDFAAAAKKLASEGYGAQTREPKTFDVVREESAVPTIETNNVPHEDTVALAVEALAASNDPPRWFHRSGAMVEVAYDEDGRALVRAIDESRLTFILSKAARFVSSSQKRGCVHVVPPKVVVQSILSGDLAFLPPLAAIAQAPALGRKGGISLKKGYCPDSKLYIASDLGWKIAAKSGQDAARWLMEEVLSDFPFQAKADLANAIGLMVQTFVRAAIAGPTPMTIVDAPTQGTGKSLLAKVCAYPALGRSVPSVNAPCGEEEWQKALISMLQAGRPIILIDNISRRVDSDSLAAALTSEDVEGRILGASRMASFPVRCTWIGTSNNAQLSPDIARRTVSIRLDAGVEKPWQRERFKRPNILEWMKSNRIEIVANILAMIEEWRKAGRPEWGGMPLGSFEEWSKTIGGILDVCKVPGFLSNWEVMFEATNVEEVSWAGFYSRWWERFGDHPVKAGELFDLATDDEALTALLGNGNEQSQKIRLGLLLRRRLRRVCGGYVVSVGSNTHRSFRFKISPSVSVGECCQPKREEYLFEPVHREGDASRDTPLDGVGNTHKHSQHSHPPPEGSSPPPPSAPGWSPPEPGVESLESMFRRALDMEGKEAGDED